MRALCPAEVGGKGQSERLVLLMTNLAVAPSRRRGGLARKLCLRAEARGRQWGLKRTALQVERQNAAAVGLYSALGFAELWQSEGTALRLEPGAFTAASLLQIADNEALLRAEPTALLTMVKGDLSGDLGRVEATNG